MVDDEEEIRRGIVEGIDWEEWGFWVVGEAPDGEAALKMIDELVPDVVLSDIRMPGVDGIDIMKYVSSRYPDMKMIILSGFSDFEYLGTAIKNGVATYLLKPTDMAEFEEAFLSLREKLDHQAALRERQQELTHMAEENAYYRHSSLLTRLIRGDQFMDHQLTDACLSFGMQPGEHFGIVVAGIEYSQEYFETISYTAGIKIREEMIGVCNELLHGQDTMKGVFFLNTRNIVCGLVSGTEENLSAFRHRVRAVKELHDFSVHFGFSRREVSITEAARLYTEARMDMDGGRYRGVLSESLKSVEYPVMEELTEFLLGNPGRQWEVVAEEFFSQFYHPAGTDDNKIDYDGIDLVCMKLLFLISDCGNRLGISVSALIARKGYKFDFLSEIESISGKRVFVEYCFSCLAQERSQSRWMDSGDMLAALVRRHIKESLDSPQLSLGMVSEQIGRTPSYVSKVFKEATGISFVGYVRKKRMEYAAGLLTETNLKTYEVAEKSGYANLTHFMKTFKKVFHVTPNEYRRFKQESSLTEEED